jgi:ABC-type antimicrobial peptide transport system permease subunit
MWEKDMGFNAVAFPLPDSYGLDVKTYLDQEGFEYSTLYLTQYYLDPPDPAQTQYSNYIAVGLLKDNPRSNIDLRVEPGTFQYTRFLEYDISVEIGASYTFFDDVTVKAADMRSNLNSSGLYTPAPYTVLLSYEDATQEALSGYPTFLMNLSAADKERLEVLGNEMGFSVNTAQSRAKSIMNGYSNYIELFSLFSILLCLVVVTFIFSLTYSIMLGRYREFMLYRVFGAAQMAIEKIVILENIVTSIISMAISIAGVVGVIRLILGMMGITGIYVIPPLTMLYLMLGGAMFVTLISILVARIFDFNHVIEVLRSE